MNILFRGEAFFILVIVFAFSLLSREASARWGRIEDESVIQENSQDKIMVRADGSYEMESEIVFSVAKESGIDELKIRRFTYDPNAESVTVLAASTTNGTVSVPVAPGQIEDKAVASLGPGFLSRNQISIPFSALQLGSKVSYRILIKHKPSFIPGQYHQLFMVGMGHFSNADTSEIRSEIPLFVKHRGIAQVASVEEGREGNFYKVKITQLKPLRRLPTDEYFPSIKDDTFPIIEVSSLQNWGPIVRPTSEKLEVALQEVLPPDFQQIVNEAGAIQGNSEKAKYVMAKLIKGVKYLGDWRAEKNYYLPRTLAEISATKQGECKDFSFATVAMLRKLGIQAWVAWVRRGGGSGRVASGLEPSSGFNPMLPGLSSFNHAIVSATIDGKVFWLDPTNDISHVGDPFSDISNRSALVLNGTSTELASIPEASQVSSLETVSYYAFRPKGRAHVMASFRLRGAQVSEINRAISSLQDEEKKKYLLFPLVDPIGSVTYLGNVSDIESNAGPVQVAGEINSLFVFGVASASQKTSVGYSFQVPLPTLLKRFLVSAGERVTGLDLGQKGIYTKKVYLTNFDLQGEVPASCSATSKWATMKRSVVRRYNGMEVSDSIQILEREVPLLEMITLAYTDFQKQLEKCFQESLLIYNWKLPNPKAKDYAAMPNPLIRNKKNLDDRVTSVMSSAAQNYYHHVYAALLLQEMIQLDSKQLAHGLARLSNTVKRLGYIQGDKFDPDHEEEQRILIEEARTLDPSEVVVKIYDASKAISQKLFDSALEIAKEILEKNPNSPGGTKLSMEILANRPASDVIRQVNINKAISMGEEYLKNATSPGSCKECILESLLNIYQIAGKSEKFEETYLRLIRETPGSAWNLLNFAGYLNNHSRYGEAAEYARKSLKLANVGVAHIKLSWALSGLALDEFRLNRHSSKGTDLCQEALEHYNGNRNCLLALGTIFKEQAAQKNSKELGELAEKYLIATRASVDSSSISIPEILSSPFQKILPAPALSSARATASSTSPNQECVVFLKRTGCPGKSGDEEQSYAIESIHDLEVCKSVVSQEAGGFESYKLTHVISKFGGQVAGEETFAGSCN